jgi:spore coat polysaccharide biosynthesis protein SpsF
MKTVAIIQARMDSTRLPNKAMKLIGRWPSLYHAARRAQFAVSDVIVATTIRPVDDVIAAMCDEHGFGCHRSQRLVDDVLGRYYDSATLCDAELIVRLTADCPFIDPHLIQMYVGQWQVNHYGPYEEYGGAEIAYHGLEFQIFDYSLLKSAHETAYKPHDREHVIPWMRQLYGFDKIERAKLRCVLDTRTDLEWFRKVAGVLDIEPPHPTVDQILEAIKNNTIPGNYNT